ncbi:MAG: hypothetical protein IPK23_09295 [Rhizobiales bacterium]|nr:hypothetical protein [Hyphomicrobiales bacterium]
MADYQAQGLKYNGDHLPCLKMEWVEGETLSVYLRRRGNDAATFHDLREKFAALAEHLEEHGIAHGDIQADNIIVTPEGDLKLIDYDGLFVDGLTTNDASEVGLPGYQHPERSLLHFGPNIDRFSFALLDLTFAALSADPSLRKQFPAGDQALLFDREDYLNPNGSKRFAAAEEIERVSALAANFKKICLASILETPRLAEFREGKNIPTPKRKPVSAKTKTVQPEVESIKRRNEDLGFCKKSASYSACKED